MNKAILLRKVSRKFGDSFALKDVSLSLPSRGIVGILGPSGCGKSTLLNILAGIDNGFMGSVKILGKEL
ncbi:MAG: ATP-binding cassette domain-containing protein, partial [Bacilli bacterium]|nr:ATP-binding cassette domain-containing protein [Bacilli bacterium]